MFKFNKKNQEVFQNGIKGTLLDLADVPDMMFAQKMLGDGYAVLPSDGNIYAPVSGTIAVAFPTGHAFGLETKQGMEILVHIGIDTVDLQGEGFESFVEQGDKVKQGDLLCKVNLQHLIDSGKSIVTPVIFTSGQSAVLKDVGHELSVGDTEFITIG